MTSRTSKLPQPNELFAFATRLRTDSRSGFSFAIFGTDR
jgi:hypothetical protein